MTTTPTATKKPNLRTLAQQGTQWQLTQDIPVYVLQANAPYPYKKEHWDVWDTIKAGDKVEVASKKTATMAMQNGNYL